jgi:hypothetical protein
VLTELADLLQEYPYRESLCEYLMLALYPQRSARRRP